MLQLVNTFSRTEGSMNEIGRNFRRMNRNRDRGDSGDTGKSMVEVIM